jgi:anti-anti-sigma factor
LLIWKAPAATTATRIPSHGVEFTMTAATRAFEIERDGQTLFCTALTDLRELDFPEVEAGASEIFALLKNGTIRNVVLDFHNTDYYGSTALGFFVKLHKRLKQHDGHLAFCRVSDHEKEILNVTGLDGLWPICATRADALRALQALEELRRVPRHDMDAQC